MQKSARRLISDATKSLPPLMKANGYKKIGNNYVKQVGENWAALGVVSSSFNGRYAARFDIGLGVYLPEVTKRDIEKLGSNKKLVDKLTSLNNCSWNLSISDIADTNVRSSWEVREELTPEQADKETEFLVRTIAIPWLDRNVSLDNFLDWISTLEGFSAADILWLFDRKEEAHNCVMAPAKNDPHNLWGPSKQAMLDEWLKNHPL